jgi:predicted nucleic acid-binding Zn ribbon protein
MVQDYVACFDCGKPKPVDAWCDSPECQPIVEAAQARIQARVKAQLITTDPQPEPAKCLHGFIGPHRVGIPAHQSPWCEHIEHAYAEHPGRANERIGRRWTAFGSDVGIWEPCPVKAMQWNGHARADRVQLTDGVNAEQIIAWVNANGGEAELRNDQSGPHIAVRTANGRAYAKPGDWITMTDAAVPHWTGSTARAFRVSGTAEPVKE